MTRISSGNIQELSEKEDVEEACDVKGEIIV